MPKTLTLSKLIACAKLLDKGVKCDLGSGVFVQLMGNRLSITEDGTEVFHMKVRVIDHLLELDYPRTTNGHDARGWAILGLLIALRYGLHQKCTAVTAGTQLEAGSYSFWKKGGIQYSVEKNLRSAIVSVMQWINQNIQQPTPAGTSVMVIRDSKTAAAASGLRRSF